jgi:hypothetical protein
MALATAILPLGCEHPARTVVGTVRTMKSGLLDLSMQSTREIVLSMHTVT